MTLKEMVNEIHDKGFSFRLMGKYVEEEAIKLGMKKGLSSTMLRRIASNDNVCTRYSKAIEKTYRRLCK